MNQYILLTLFTLIFVSEIQATDVSDDESTSCSDQTTVVECIFTWGCCWMEADVKALGSVSICTEPVGASEDVNNFCNKVINNKIDGYTNVKTCICNNAKLWFMFIFVILCCCFLGICCCCGILKCVTKRKRAARKLLY